LQLGLSGCYGPFYLVRKVHQFNGEVSDNKWVVELVYLVCTWLPIYGLAGAADALIFNSIEFWTGSNPLATAEVKDGVKTKRIVRGDYEAILQQTQTPNGPEFSITQFNRGTELSSLKIQPEAGNMVARNAAGDLLFSATTLEDGRVQVTDAEGRPMGSYTQKEAQQLLASAARN